MFCMQVDNDLLHPGIENRLSPVYSSLYLSIFLSVYIFVKDMLTTVLDRKFIIGLQNNNDTFCRGIENRLCPIYPSLYMFTFLFLHAIKTLIFHNRFLSSCLR